MLFQLGVRTPVALTDDFLQIQNPGKCPFPHTQSLKSPDPLVSFMNDAGCQTSKNNQNQSTTISAPSGATPGSRLIANGPPLAQQLQGLLGLLGQVPVHTLQELGQGLEGSE